MFLIATMHIVYPEKPVNVKPIKASIATTRALNSHRQHKQKRQITITNANHGIKKLRTRTVSGGPASRICIIPFQDQNPAKQMCRPPHTAIPEPFDPKSLKRQNPNPVSPEHLLKAHGWLRIIPVCQLWHWIPYLISYLRGPRLQEPF